MNHNAKDLYDSTAQSYDERHNNPTSRYMRKEEEKIIRKYSRGRALDLGCGTGAHLHLHSGIGLDFSYSMLKAAQEKHSTPFVQAKIEELPFFDGMFDTTLCMFTTLNICDFRQAIKEMARVTKKSGYCIVSVARTWKDKPLLERLTKEPSEEKTNIRIEGFRLPVQSIGKDNLVKEFSQRGFRLKEFHGMFKMQRPYWGWYKDFSRKEKLILAAEKFLPEKTGRIYIAVFKKSENK